MPVRPPYVSPFPDAEPLPGATGAAARALRFLARVEPRTRELLEGEQVSQRVAKFVAGGGSAEGRARRAEVAIYARARLECEGWPEIWVLVFFTEADAAACKARRDRGLPRRTVEESCAAVELPAEPPPPRRRTKREREASGVADRVAQIEELAASLGASLRGDETAPSAE